jgi:putative flippase GtrA
MSAELNFKPPQSALWQFLKYVLVGLLTNCLGYLLYLALTYAWGMPKLTMTVLYSSGAMVSFFANRRFTFRHDGHIGAAGIRFAAVQVAGYLLNLTLLVIFVDRLGFAHQLVQAIAIVVVAVFLFLLTRAFVFKTKPVKDGAN